MESTLDFPTWDWTEYFESIDSSSFNASLNEHGTNVAKLLVSLENAGEDDVASLIDQFNKVIEQHSLISSYIYGVVTTDSDNEVAMQKLGDLETIGATFSRCQSRWISLIGKIEPVSFFAKNPDLKAYEYVFTKTRKHLQHRMPKELEDLAADFALSGGRAWGNLHGNWGSQIMVELKSRGGEAIPMSAVRNLAYESSESLRKEAFEAELKAWDENKGVMIASLNGVKGHAITLFKGRGWKSPLEAALFDNGMHQETLDAMLGAARASFPAFRRYLNAKAKLIGKQKLAFFDLFAPLGEGENEWTYPRAESFIADTFTGYSSRLGDLSKKAFRNKWVDAGPRKGKRDGAYCTETIDGDSRILMNYKPSFAGLSTLAHELGHAYHNLCLASQPPMLRDTPMTLAETASIFCETIVRREALRTSDTASKLEILEASLMGSTQVVVDISSRFQFEDAFFKARESGFVTATDACDMMLAAQKDTYGEGLDENYLHPYMWAAKPHYYEFEFGYYNYPYMFGLLFATGLYAIYEQRGKDFLDTYDELLASTGRASAYDLAEKFGFDISSSAFWEGSLRTIEQEIDEYEQIANSLP